MDNIEIHTKNFAMTKSKDPNKNGKTIGLQTRLIIHPPKGAMLIVNFDYLFQAIEYIKKTYGDITNINKTYSILSNYKLYGKRGYQWRR